MKTIAATNTRKALIASGLVANALTLAIWIFTYSPRPIAGIVDAVGRLGRVLINRAG
jgi:hypothetical protein